MTPWVKLNAVSFVSAFVLLVGWKVTQRFFPVSSTANRLERAFSRESVFCFLLAAIAVLYFASLSEFVTFDEYSYSIGIRERLFVGANHFLSHFLSRLIYVPLRAVTSNTLLIRQLLNVVTAVATIFLFRSALFRMTRDRALAN